MNVFPYQIDSDHNLEMPCIILVAGGIGCGKTTFINYLLCNESKFSGYFESRTEHLFSQNNHPALDVKKTSNLVAIHFDQLCSIKEQEQLMKSLRGWHNFRVDLLMAAERLISYVYNSENSISGPLTERSDRLLEKITSLSKERHENLHDAVILVEDNFYYRSMRYDWFQIARRCNFGFGTVFVKCPPSVAVERNSTRGYQIPDTKIRKILSLIEYPEPSKYRWEKFSLVIDSSQDFNENSLIDVYELITEVLKHPAEAVLFEQTLEARKICSKNVIHQADKILRKIVSKKIACAKDAVPEGGLESLVTQLLDIRHHMLLDVKKGVIHLPIELVDKIQNIGIESVLEAYEECLENIFNVTVHERSL